jgi:hypothetical protein
MQCQATTLKGDKCKKLAKVGDYCKLHSEKAVFNPYYNTYVQYESEKNCSPTRDSLKRIPIDQENRIFASSYCDVLPLNNVVNVIGPVSYNEYQYGKYNIGIFGEIHSINKIEPDLSPRDTLNFSSFIQSILTQNWHQFDLFIEMAFKQAGKLHSKTGVSNTMFNLLEIELDRCLTFVKKCPFKNLRAHYIDYRDMIPENNYSETIDELYTSIFWRKHDISEVKGTISQLVDLKIYKEESKRVLKFIETDKKILKQLNNCPLKDEIIVFIKARMKKYYSDIKTLLDNNPTFLRQKWDKNSPNSLKRLIAEIIESFIAIYISVMDVYALARMFRTFGGTSPENIIVYVGDYHAKVYCDFLDYINARLIIRKSWRDDDTYISFTLLDKARSFLFANPDHIVD